MSSSEAPFEVRVSETMQALWNELGLDDEAQKVEFGELQQAFQQVYQQFVDKLSTRCKETRSEIEHVQSIHKQAMKAYGLSESDISDALPAIESANLLEQLETAKQAYQNFKMTCSDRIQKLEGLAHTANDMFDALGVPAEERGEYAEVGDIDYSRARIERFRKRIQELKSDVEERTREVRAAKTTINNLVTELNHVAEVRERVALFERVEEEGEVNLVLLEDVPSALEKGDKQRENCLAPRDVDVVVRRGKVLAPVLEVLELELELFVDKVDRHLRLRLVALGQAIVDGRLLNDHLLRVQALQVPFLAHAK